MYTWITSSCYAAAGELPAKEGRHFNAQLDKSLESLGAQVDCLQDEGAEAVLAAMKAGREKGRLIHFRSKLELISIF